MAPKMAHLTAPVAYVAHMRTPLVVLLPFSRLIEVGDIVEKEKHRGGWLCDYGEVLLNHGRIMQLSRGSWRRSDMMSGSPVAGFYPHSEGNAVASQIVNAGSEEVNSPQDYVPGRFRRHMQQHVLPHTRI